MALGRQKLPRPHGISVSTYSAGAAARFQAGDNHWRVKTEPSGHPVLFTLRRWRGTA